MKDRTYKKLLLALMLAFVLFAGLAIGVAYTWIFRFPFVTAGGMGAY